MLLRDSGSKVDTYRAHEGTNFLLRLDSSLCSKSLSSSSESLYGVIMYDYKSSTNHRAENSQLEPLLTLK